MRRCTSRPNVCSVLLLCACAATVLAAALPAFAGPRWMLVYYRQVGNHVNGGGSTVENHLFREDGSPGAFVGATNRWNLGTAIWGYATTDGWLRIEPNDHQGRELEIYDPGVPTDQSPVFYQFPPGDPGPRYSHETHWLYVSDDADITAHPTTPVYHYDLVNGLNSSTGTEPPGANSDEFSLTTWTQPVCQTFIVPAGINRIVSCKAWGVHVNNYRYVASIHRDNGGDISTWPQVGPSTMSRFHSPVDFVPVIAHWPLNAVEVTPGQRYALKVRPEDNGGFNSYATNSDNYSDGQLYLGSDPVPGRDLIAVVVGLTVGEIPQPMLSLNKTTVSSTITEGESLSPSTFTVTNTGDGAMAYTVNESRSWFSVNPTSGSSSGESDTITITYDLTGLEPGSYNGLITVIAPDAPNSPKTVQVSLTINDSLYTPADNDRDFDVDQSDYGWFQACFSGDGILQTDPACASAKLDSDDDVDQFDFQRFMACMAGANVTVDPNCAD